MDKMEDGKFLKGIGISVWQASGDKDSNWTRFTKTRWPFGKVGTKTCKGDYMLERTPDFWNRFREDIALAHELGVQSLRLSIEWGRIEPEQGVIDKEAIKRYHEILDCMQQYGIEPMATLHHFVHPGWFEDLGGWESEQSVELYTKFAVTCFKAFGKRIDLWATFNEPTCMTTLGWITGMHPPGKVARFWMCGQVMLHILQAHTSAYKAIRALPDSDHAKIGIVHHQIRFVPAGRGPLYALARYCGNWMTYWWGWDNVHQWLKTGFFHWELPLFGTIIKYQNPGGKPPCDWLGVNYYSRPVVNWNLMPSVMPGEKMSDMMYPLHAEGLYTAIKHCSQIGVPLYITETGIATTEADLRAQMINSYIRQVLRAIKDGYDVRGFYYWTLMDNFEWNMGYTIKFGLVGWEPDGSRDREIKPSAKMLISYFQAIPDDLKLLAATCARLDFPPSETSYEDDDAFLRKLKLAGATPRGTRQALAGTAVPPGR